ncbi:MAG: hypothetical protein U0835_14470 [Isosphaeraceae bacterium]
MSSTPNPLKRPPRRFLRRIAVCGLALLAALGALLAALPSLLSSSRGRDFLLARADQALAPGSVQVGSFGFSWFGPTRMTDVVLRDHHKEAVVTAPRATLDRTLFQLIFDRPRLGTLELQQGFLDAEREADGTIDLYETLRPILGKNPKTDLRIKLTEGKVRFRAPGYSEPIVAEPASVDLHIRPKPAPLQLDVQLRRRGNDPSAAAASLELAGQIDTWAMREQREGEVDLRLATKDWPLSFLVEGVQCAGRLNGKAVLRKKAGVWESSGDAAVVELAAQGESLRGDQPRLERLTGRWDVTAGQSGWSVRQLEVESPIVKLHGKAADVSSAMVEGTLDLAALASQFPRALRIKEGVTLERGTAELRVSTGIEKGTSVVDASAKVSDLKARDGEKPLVLDAPALLSARLLRAKTGELRLDRLTADTAFLKATARGDLAAGTATLDGELDLAGFQRQFRSLVDFGSLELSGRGSIKGEYALKDGNYRGHLETSLAGIRVRGVGPVDLTREQASILADVGGQAGASGWPSGWRELAARCSSADFNADLSATSADSRARLTLMTPVEISDLKADLTGRISAVFKGPVTELDSLELQATPPKDRPDLPPIKFAARGSFERKKGELTLRPFWPGTPPGALALLSDGMTVRGLDRLENLQFEGGVAGDLAAVGPWLPSAYRQVRGVWQARGRLTSGEAGRELGGEIALNGLALTPPSGEPGPAPDMGVGPMKVTLQATVPPDLALAEVDLRENSC